MASSDAPPERALLIAGNALPLIGTIGFGWGAAPAVILIWLDAFLCNLQFVAGVLASGLRIMPLPTEGPHLRAQRIGAGIGVGVVAFAFCSPSIATGIGVYQLLEHHFASEAFARVLASPWIYLWLAIELAFGSYRIAKAYAAGGYRDAEHLRNAAPVQFANIANRCAVLLALAWLAQLLGRFGLIAFLVVATCFISYVDLHENWLAHLQAKVEGAGRAWRARRRG